MAVGFQKVQAETLISNGSFETGDWTNTLYHSAYATVTDSNIGTGTVPYHGTYYVRHEQGTPLNTIFIGTCNGNYWSGECLNVLASASLNPSFGNGAWIKLCYLVTSGKDGNIFIGTETSTPTVSVAFDTVAYTDDNICVWVKNLDQPPTKNNNAFDYVTITKGSEVKPVITSIDYKPSPATYNNDINVYTLTTGSTQRLQCGTSAVNTSNLCSTGSVANDPSCVFKNTLQNGDTNVFCQAYNINGVYSDVNRVLITSSGYGTPISNFVTPITNTTLVSQTAPNTLQYQVVLEPIIESDENMVFVAYNTSSGSVDVNFQINNSLTDGKRYFVYTANELDYSRGIWSLSDELNFGVSGLRGLQKIWNAADQTYNYFVLDSGSGRGLVQGQKKYYKLVYAEPFKHWDSLNTTLQTDWDIALNPLFDVTENHYLDTYPTSVYSNLRNVYRTKFPSITTNVTNGNLILAVTADTNTAANLLIGNYTGSNDSTSTFGLTTSPYTFNVTTSNYPLIKTLSSSFAFVNLSDYALMERGFFVAPLKILNTDGTELLPQLYGSISRQTLTEGKDFRIQTSLYNRDGRLSKIEAFAYIDSITPAKQIAYWTKDLNSQTANEVYNLDWFVTGIIDINGTTSRNVIIEVRATDSSNNWYYIQSDALKMQQYPNNPNDLTISANLTNTIVAQSPKFFFNIRSTAPETLRGVDFRIYDDNQSWTASDYNTIFYKDIDFVCRGFDCSFNRNITQYVFPRAGHWYMTAIALLTTQNADKNNSLTSVTNSFVVDWKSWNIAKIFDVVERQDRTYRNDEKIPLALALRTSDYANLKGELLPKLIVWNCSAADSTDCIAQDINYTASGFYYNKSSGLNVWYFTNVFALQNGNLLPDGNFIRFSATLSDIKGQFNSSIQPLLTTRCQIGQNAAGWLSNMLVSYILYPALGCNTGLQTSDIVEINTNQVMESRIKIDASHDVNAPDLIGFYCLNNDMNNTFKDTLKQTINCEVPYRFNETNIDKFDIYLTNNYSDMGKDPIKGQYIKITVPYEIIAANDMTILNQQIKAKYGGTAPVNLIGLIVGGIRNFMDSGSCVLWGWLKPDWCNKTQDEGSVYAADQADTNYNKPISVVEGMLNVTISGIKVINKYNYEKKYSDLNVVNTKDFLEYAAYKNYRIPIEKTHYRINVATDPNAENAVFEGDVDSPLVVNVSPSFMEVKIISNDANVPDQTLPYTMDFKLIMDMFYGNINVERMSKDITLGGYIDDFGIPKGDGNGVLRIVGDTVDSIGDFLDNPNDWLVKNWFGLFIMSMVIVGLSLVYNQFQKNGGEINFFNRR